MDNLERDVLRLENMAQDSVGLEGIGFATRLSDFISYYFSRFLRNAKDSFKSFSRTELDHFNSRYSRQLPSIFVDSLVDFDNLIVPIPKGMIGSYHDTLDDLLGIMAGIASTTLDDDLRQILYALEKGDVATLPKVTYSKTKYEQTKKKIGSLYSSNGLSSTLAPKALVSLKQTSNTNESLLTFVNEYYPTALEICKTVEKIDKLHDVEMIDPKYLKNFQDVLMDLAYRTSIYAIVLDHVQTMEHTFVRVLNILHKAAK